MKSNIFTCEIILIVIAIAVFGWLSARKIEMIRTEAAAAASKESLTKLRDAVNVYRWEHENRCPENLDLLVPEYMEKIPSAYKTLSNSSSSVKYGPYGQTFDGRGGWVYVNDEQAEDYCEVFLNI